VVGAGIALQARYGVDRTRLTVYPLPGPEPAQPERGNGWRILAEVPLMDAPPLQIADEEGAYQRLMARLGIANPPQVVMARATVFALMTSGGPNAGTPRSGPCDWVHFDGLAIDILAGVVTANVRHPRPPGVGCDTMFVPFVYVIAVDRAELPARPFTLRLVDRDCVPCERQALVVAPR
jgi:hypothetical protein